MKQGDREARRLLIESVLPITLYFAKRFSPSVDTLDDYIQEANLAVIKALKDYDARITRFSTYIERPVKWAMINYRVNANRVIRIPHHNFKKPRRKPHNHSESQKALMEHDVFRPDDMWNYALIENDPTKPVIEEDEKSHQMAIISSLVEKLSAIEQDIVLGRLAGETLGDIGIRHRKTKEWVRQQQVIAIEKMKSQYNTNPRKIKNDSSGTE